MRSSFLPERKAWRLPQLASHSDPLSCTYELNSRLKGKTISKKNKIRIKKRGQTIRPAALIPHDVD
jgi:hypothetical protein